MTHALDTQTHQTTVETGALLDREHRRHGAQEVERPIDSFLSELRRMSPKERIRASRYTMNRWEYWVYAARFPDEVPLVNGELERIAHTLE